MTALVALLFLAQGPAAHFTPLEFVVGSCWVGTFPDGKQTDEHCFEWVFDKKFIRDKHVVRAGGTAVYQGETIYSWDAASRRIAFSYYNSEGSVLTGKVEETADGLVFPQRYPTDTGVTEIQSTWTRPGPDSYRVHVTQKSGDTWTTLWTMELRRR